MREIEFKQVDVFTQQPFLGNPVAVVLDGQDIDTETMQRIAAWTNLSETTFVQKASSPEADYRLRIFTPQAELPFAGHPSVGSAHAILQSGLMPEGKTQLVQECGAGLIELTVEGSGDGQRVYVKAPPAVFTPLNAEQETRLAKVMGAAPLAGLSSSIVDVGPRWLIARMAGDDSFLELKPDYAEMTRFSHDLKMTGITIFGFTGDAETPISVRSFAPAHGIDEDPVCGSGNASVGAYLLENGLLEQVGDEYLSAQGAAIGRDGFVSVRVDRQDKSVLIGGSCVTCIEGKIRVP